MRLPVKKSIFWVFYHRQDQLFVSMLLLLSGVTCFVLAFANFKTTPASIIFFVVAIYCIYCGSVTSWKLFKEWRNV